MDKQTDSKVTAAFILSRRSTCTMRAYPHSSVMRTHIVIDEKLMRDGLRLTGLKTKREAVEMGLRTLLRLRQQSEIRRLRGKVDWIGDLDALRVDW